MAHVCHFLGLSFSVCHKLLLGVGGSRGSWRILVHLCCEVPYVPQYQQLLVNLQSVKISVSVCGFPRLPVFTYSGLNVCNGAAVQRGIGGVSQPP